MEAQPGRSRPGQPDGPAGLRRGDVAKVQPGGAGRWAGWRAAAQPAAGGVADEGVLGWLGAQPAGAGQAGWRGAASGLGGAGGRPGTYRR